MSVLPFEVLSIIANLVMFVFVGYYLFSLRTRVKEIEKREIKIDTDYHQVVDNTLAKERRIIEDATSAYHQILDNALAKERKILEQASFEANQIITGAQYVNRTSKETVDAAMQKMIVDINQEAFSAAKDFMASYQTTLKQLSGQSLTGFQTASSELHLDLQKQMKEFHEKMLPELEKQLEEYKQTRLKQAEETITNIVQRVSREVFNAAIPIEEHHKLLIEALEKAKKQGIFN